MRASARSAKPFGVRGPVLLPPCMRQRPFSIAGAWQGQPVVRALAPQRGARLGLPRGWPLRVGPGSGGAEGFCGAVMLVSGVGAAVVVVWVIGGPGALNVSYMYLRPDAPSAPYKLLGSMPGNRAKQWTSKMLQSLRVWRLCVLAVARRGGDRRVASLLAMTGDCASRSDKGGGGAAFFAFDRLPRGSMLRLLGVAPVGGRMS